MRGSAVRLGRILGIEIRLDYSWFIVFAMLTWSLGGYYFPLEHPGQPTSILWLMGLLTSVLFFSSVVAHELAHCLVARAHGVKVRHITLFIFGGAAQIGEEPRRPRDEFLMALAGPATSLVLAAIFGVFWWVGRGTGSLFHTLATWLARINAMLALFNLIPGFPLDGGRVCRSIIWRVTGNLRQATRIASRLGQAVAFGFVFYGLWQILVGNWGDGLWIAFIGWFLNNAAVSSVQQQATLELLKGHTVSDVMTTDCPRIPHQLTLDLLVDQVLLQSGQHCFAVMHGDQMEGLLTAEDIQGVPRERWPFTRAGDVMTARALMKAVRPTDHLAGVLARMADDEVGQYPVIENGQFLGIVAREHLLRLLHFGKRR